MLYVNYTSIKQIFRRLKRRKTYTKIIILCIIIPNFQNSTWSLKENAEKTSEDLEQCNKKDANVLEKR